MHKVILLFCLLANSTTNYAQSVEETAIKNFINSIDMNIWNRLFTGKKIIHSENKVCISSPEIVPNPFADISTRLPATFTLHKSFLNYLPVEKEQYLLPVGQINQNGPYYFFNQEESSTNRITGDYLTSPNPIYGSTNQIILESESSWWRQNRALATIRSIDNNPKQTRIRLHTTMLYGPLTTRDKLMRAGVAIGIGCTLAGLYIGHHFYKNSHCFFPH